jgi:hypothetical protein
MSGRALVLRHAGRAQIAANANTTTLEAALRCTTITGSRVSWNTVQLESCSMFQVSLDGAPPQTPALRPFALRARAPNREEAEFLLSSTYSALWASVEIASHFRKQSPKRHV